MIEAQFREILQNNKITIETRSVRGGSIRYTFKFNDLISDGSYKNANFSSDDQKRIAKELTHRNINHNMKFNNLPKFHIYDNIIEICGKREDTNIRCNYSYIRCIDKDVAEALFTVLTANNNKQYNVTINNKNEIPIYFDYDLTTLVRTFFESSFEIISIPDDDDFDDMPELTNIQ